DVKRPVKVGERINTQGSRKMKDMLKSGDYDGIIELGKQQYRLGADVLDVCAVLTERDTEKRDAVIIFKNLAESVPLPLMIDSTDPEVIKAALENYPGTAFINSVNLEDGGVKARAVFALAREHGGFVVNLVIDEEGMAKTVERKINIAERLYRIAVEEYKLEPYRLIFDLLTFTLGTGEKEYARSAVNTYEGIKELKNRFPGVLTVLGVSNVSFGLPLPARKVLNAVFLGHAVRAGLDLAIINPADTLNAGFITDEELKLSEDLIFDRHAGALDNFVEFFTRKSGEKVKKAAAEASEELSAGEKLKRCVFERDKVKIVPLVDEALQKYSARDIINSFLMDAMKEVGDKLDSGEMVLPYVLQSAEVMRKAIEHLEKFLPADKSSSGKKKVLLATVFGDVHDIGKNLVKMILENNGFTVIDLGKQVPVEKIVESAVRNKVDAVGLSALLVSTARHMKECVQSMHEAGLDHPVLVGGAPVNENFAKDISVVKDGSVYRGGVFYAKDAFAGLKIMRAVSDPSLKKKSMDEYFGRFNEISPCPAGKGVPGGGGVTGKNVKKNSKAARAPFYGVRPLVNIPVDEVFKYLDERLLFELAWGVKLKDRKEKDRIIEEEYKPLLRELKDEAIRKAWLDLKAVYGYFPCGVSGEDMEILDESGGVREVINFPRSPGAGSVSLADYFSGSREDPDIVVFQAVTAGDKINKAISALNERKEFTRAFFVHGLSVYLAEALAAYIHDLIRKELGLKEGQGKRYSPGYPLWRNLEDQKKIFRLLDAEKLLGVKLTEGYQMVPEQSTTAMVVCDEAAEY
ncbi:MAG: dihydropteroate synthase, partial [Candidatus Omnitrophota bacterium]